MTDAEEAVLMFGFVGPSMRHNGITIPLRYAHLAPADKKAAVDALESALKSEEQKNAGEPKMARLPPPSPPTKKMRLGGH
jgi:hypothetical protein